MRDAQGDHTPSTPTTPDPPPAPRISPYAGEAPFNPASYFLVGFFGGLVALAVVAVMNLDRMVAWQRLRQGTFAAIGVVSAVTLAAVLTVPAEWLEPVRNLRIGMRIAAVALAVILTPLHNGPAQARMFRSGSYASMWSAIGIIIGAGIGQAVLSVILVGLR